MKMLLSSLGEETLRGRRVLVRADLNVPLDEAGDVADDTRLGASLPTLQAVRAAGASVVLLSHLGRPKGSPDPRYSLRQVAVRLADLLGHNVGFSDTSTGAGVRSRAHSLRPGEVLLLENTRFEPGDVTNDPALSAFWAGLADLFVNDAFGAAHRAHASTTGVAEAVRRTGGLAVAGLLMERELRFLSAALESPERPFTAVLGGAKISGKIDVIRSLLPRVDRLLVGGAMANTFFKAMGLEVGGSLVEEDRLEVARTTLEEAGERLLLPVDCVVAPEITADATVREVPRDGVASTDRIGDIGPVTRAIFSAELERSRTVVWNGPMGVFELASFSRGTLALAHAVASATDRGALTVVGGGDSIAALEAAEVTERVTHVSTGGGASLELLAGARLPGVEALNDALGGGNP